MEMDLTRKWVVILMNPTDCLRLMNKLGPMDDRFLINHSSQRSTGAVAFILARETSRKLSL